jgi:tetratricopeptide (TPR) repeat protein
MRNGQFAERRPVGMAGYHMTPKDPCEHAQHLAKSGESKAALQHLEEALTEEPQNARLWLLKGVLLGSAERHAEALSCFERCTDLNPGIFTGWYHKAVAASFLGQGARAIEYYRRARRLDPTDASSAFNLGMELCNAEEFAEALEQFWDAKTLGHARGAEAHTACGQMRERREEKRSSVT